MASRLSRQRYPRSKLHYRKAWRIWPATVSMGLHQARATTAMGTCRKNRRVIRSSMALDRWSPTFRAPRQSPHRLRVAHSEADSRSLAALTSLVGTIDLYSMLHVFVNTRRIASRLGIRTLYSVRYFLMLYNAVHTSNNARSACNIESYTTAHAT